MPRALEREDGHQVVDRIMDIAAIGGPETGGYPPLTEERHDVIEPERAEVPHIGRHEVTERTVSLRDQRMGILRRDTPVLSLQCQRIRWRPDSGAHAVHRLVGPGFRTARIHADGVVAIQPDRHAELAREVLCASQLLVGKPLQPGIELHGLGMRGLEFAHARMLRITKLQWPHRPAPVALRILPAQCARRSRRAAHAA